MKNKMKKSFAMAICAIMVLSLAACGGAGETAAPSNSETKAPEAAASVDASNWPEQAITMLCCYPAGNWTDLTLRVVCARMEEELGVPITVKNVVGADGATAMTELLNAKPDGYTLGEYQHSSLTIGTWLEDLPFSIESFDYFGTCGAYTHGVAVDADSDIYNLDDLMEYVKDRKSVV